MTKYEKADIFKNMNPEIEILTLKKALENFHIEYSSHLSHKKPNISSKAVQFFKSHDIAHVLFGCDISLYGEGAVKLWTIFGTDIGFINHLKEYRHANAYDLAMNRKFGFWNSVKSLLKLLYSTPFLIYKSQKMKKRWPWANFDQFLEKPIEEVRKEFNILV